MMYREEGFTLTELLVSTAIAGLLMAGVAQAFYANTQTFAVVSEQSELQENGRLALQLIGNQLQQAGYVKALSPQDFYDPQSRDDVFPLQSNVEFAGLNFPAGSIVGGLDNAAISDVRSGSDILMVRYQKTASGEGLFRDCAGTRLDDDYASDSAVIGFFVSSDYALKCVRADGQRWEIIDGVEDLQVLYGIDDDGAEPVRADSYLAAGDMTAEDWTHVVAVSIALLTRPGTTAAGAGRDRIARTYQVNDEARSFDDNVARSVYSQTFVLRNRTF